MNVKLYIAQYLKCLFDNHSIDSFRPRHTNTHVILEEMIEVCEAIEAGKIRDFYLKKLIEEATHIIKKDLVIIKNKKKQELMLSQINNFINKSQEVTYLKQYLKTEINYFRKNYFIALCRILLDASDGKEEFGELKNIRNILNSFISECVYNGASFKYLRKITSLKNDFSKGDLKKVVKRLSKMRYFNVYLPIYNIHQEISSFLKSYFKKTQPGIGISEKWPKNIKPVPSYLKFSGWRRTKKSVLVFSIKKIRHYDQYSAILSVQNSLEYLINLAHIFHPQRYLKIGDKGIVYDYSLKEYLGVDYVNVVDCYRNGSPLVVEEKIAQCYKLAPNILNKIKTSASYLDISLNEYRPISRFFNSWISIEVLFNTLKKEKGADHTYTISYISKYVPEILSIFYISKVFKYLAERVALVLEEESQNFIKGNKIDIKLFVKYYNNSNNLDGLVSQLSNNIELADKIQYYFSILNDQEKLLSTINNHNNTVSAHIERLYRYRNNIVHGGEKLISDSGLYNITSLLMLSINNQEYATQLIDHIAELCSKLNQKYNLDNILSVFEVFSVLKGIIVQKLQSKSFDKNDFLKMLSPLDFIK